MSPARAALLLLCAAHAACLDAPPSSTGPVPGGSYSLQFFGHPFEDNGIDRVWIPAERPSPAGRLGSGDFTIELWLKAQADDIPEQPTCPDQWWRGAIVLDREFFESPPRNGNIGISLYRTTDGTGVAAGFEVAGAGEVNLCGDAPIGDGGWHHVAMTRSQEDQVSIWIDGVMVASELGPAGDGSFAQDLGTGVDPADPFMVLGGPKQGASDAPGFIGLLDDLRLSHADVYQQTFDPPLPPIEVDPERTLAIWRFDEGDGVTIEQLAGDGAAPGELRVGGDPVGPLWSDDVAAAE